MSFMDSYKRLDNLCKDMNGIGVTGYIETMERTINGEYYVSGWKDDYYKLKHCRWARNKIAHDNYADEYNTCDPDDIQWVENFYHRIIIQDDPLAQFYRSTSYNTQDPRPRTTDYGYYSQPPYQPPIRQSKNIGCFTMMCITITSVVLLALIAATFII